MLRLLTRRRNTKAGVELNRIILTKREIMMRTGRWLAQAGGVRVERSHQCEAGVAGEGIWPGCWAERRLKVSARELSKETKSQNPQIPPPPPQKKRNTRWNNVVLKRGEDQGCVEAVWRVNETRVCLYVLQRWHRAHTHTHTREDQVREEQRKTQPERKTGKTVT